MGKITKEEALERLEDWADFLELDTDSDLYKSICDDLMMAVKLEKLNFSEDSREFTYILSQPIKGKDGEITMVQIKTITMEDKKVLEQYEGESVKGTIALLSKYTGLRTSETSQLLDIDITRINAVVFGFFNQQLPGEKKR